MRLSSGNTELFNVMSLEDYIKEFGLDSNFIRVMKHYEIASRSDLLTIRKGLLTCPTADLLNRYLGEHLNPKQI